MNIKKTILKPAIPFLLFSLLFFMLCAWSCRDEKTKGLQPVHTLENPQAAEGTVITALGDHAYPPFEYIDDRGLPAGFNVDIARSAARAMHLNLDIKLGQWSMVREKLEQGKADLLLGMFKTSERDRKVDFTIPHFISSYVIFTRDDSEIKTEADLKDAEILVLEGDLGHDYVKRKKLGRSIKTKGKFSDVMLSLSRGEGDCALVAYMQGAMLIKKIKLDNIITAGPPILQKNYCIAVKEGNSRLLATLNEGLNIIKSTGEYDLIFKKWFGIYEEKSLLDKKYIMPAAVLFSALLGTLLISAFWSWYLRKQVRIKTEALTGELEINKVTQQKLKETLQDLEASNRETEKARSAAEKASMSKSQFMATISHELRTPLHGIIGMSDLLANTPLQENQKDLLKMIGSSADNLYRIISDLLDFSQVTEGSLSVKKEPFQLGSFLDKTLPLMKYWAKEKDLQFITDIEGEEKTLITDQGRLSQIMFNLVSNAVKYTDTGSVTLKIRCGEVFTATVSDTGRGIPENRLTDIFTPFTRLSSRPSLTDRGLGLGLSIVRLLVELLEGTINVSSKPGLGSAFTVEIPIEPEKEKEIAGPSGSDKEDHTLPAGIKILIAEDETINRVYLEKIFGKKQIKADTAPDGAEALRMAMEKKYDLILMDISMPEMDGTEAARSIREFEKNSTIKTPIIALTAHAYPSDIEKCYNAGMNGYVSKPFHPGKLFREIRKVLDAPQDEGQNRQP